MNTNKPMTILRLPEVIRLTNLSRSTIYNRIQQGVFPPQISLGGRSVGWLEHEIVCLLGAWLEGNDEAHLKRLVETLLFERAVLAIRTKQ